MSLHHSCNENTGAVAIWDGPAPYADLTDTSTNFEQKLERAKEIVAAVEARRRLERGIAAARGRG